MPTLCHADCRDCRLASAGDDRDWRRHREQPGRGQRRRGSEVLCLDAAEIDAILGADADTFKRIYDVGPHGNWEGKTILNRLHAMDLQDAETEAQSTVSRARLLAARASRIRPGKDEKVLADWNGLIISALAFASQTFERPD